MSQQLLKIGLWRLSALMLLAPVFGWRQTGKLFGTSAWTIAKRMAYFASRTKYFLRSLLLALIAALIAVAIVLARGTDTSTRLALAAPFFALCVALTLRTLQPPVVLFLTSSSLRGGRLLAEINLGLTPLRAVGLLDPKRIGLLQRFAVKADNLRTREPEVWKSLVCRLIDLTLIVVIDTRGEAEPVCQETLLMLHAKRVRKALFITDDDGRSRSLEVHAIDPAKHALPRVTERELIAQLRYWTQSPGYLPCPFDSRVLDDEAGLVPENFDTLSSILTVALFDQFDSSALIERALDSEKKLLVVYGPLVALNEEIAQWAFNVAWHFVHDPKLSLVVLRQSGQLMVRIQFLREVCGSLKRIQAESRQGRLTFEKLNQPEPILAAIQSFADELMAQATKRGATFQEILH